MEDFSHQLTPQEREVNQEQIKAVFAVLESWFQAIEAGTAHHRLPDPAFSPPPGRPVIEEDLVEQFITELDREIDQDSLGSRGKWCGADATSEFSRLGYPQRVSLIQELMCVLLTADEMAQRAQFSK